MKLTLIRDHYYEDATLGKLYINDGFACFTLEDTDRRLEDGGEKIPGQTAIPRGTYRVTITQSARFGKPLPLLADVPGFAGIRIHPGNTSADTEGCILVGTSRAENSICNSRAAFVMIFEHIRDALEAGEAVEIEIQ